jgi:hypothetical protein
MGKCPNSMCPFTLQDFLSKPTQKLVDSMIVCDLLLVSNSNARVVVVSSDDDLWPGIYTALGCGCQIIRIRTSTKPTQITYPTPSRAILLEFTIS